MCSVMVSYFKINQKFQRNKRQSISEHADPSKLDQAYQIMRGAIIVDHIRYGASRLEHTKLRRMIRLEKSRVKASGEKRDILERSENITQRENSRSKREKKSVVRISERRVRKVVWIIAEQEVQYRTTQSKENIQLEKVKKNGGKVHGTMKDNAMRTAKDTRQDVNGGAVEMRDIGDGRKFQR